MRFGLRSDFERRRRSKGSGRSNRAPVVALPLAVALVLWSSPALAHDPSAWGGLFRSRDDGVTWFLAGPGRVASAAIALAISPTDVDHLLLATDSGLLRSRSGGGDWVLDAATGSPERVRAIVGGQIWERVDGAPAWTSLSPEIPALDALALDGNDPARLLAVGASRMFRSDDRGASWRRVGVPLPEANTSVRGIAASGEVIVLATDRGLYRTVDGGARWQFVVDNLPAHLEAG